MSFTVDTELDTRGLHCPMPLLKAKLALNQMQDEQVLRVVATDAGSWDDFEAFVRQSPHTLLDRNQSESEDGTPSGSEYIFCIKKGS